MSLVGDFLRGLVRGLATARPPAADDFVYVNQDGSARELAPDERHYLPQSFAGGDGARPHIKASYDARDGWGSLSGFLARREVPRRIQVEPVNRAYVPATRDALRESHEDSRAASRPSDAASRARSRHVVISSSISRTPGTPCAA